MARKRTVKLELGSHTLELRMNFAKLAEIQDTTNVNLLSEEGVSQMIQPNVLPKALSIMAGGKPTAEQIAEEMDITDLQAVSEAITKLLEPDPT